MSGAYEADPDGLRRAVQAIKDLPGMARSIAEDFRNDEESYLGWNGRSDDYFQQSNPNYKKANEGCLGFVTALGDAMDGLVSATLESLDSIEGNQQYNAERIGQHKGTADLTDGEGSTGGGKH